jgi:hypothetical protein
MVKVKEDMAGWNMWEHGLPDSRLTVIEQVEDRIYPNGDHKAQWLCECNCEKHNRFITLGESIRNGHTKSCGCIQKEKAVKTVKDVLHKVNRYDLSRDYGVGWASNTNEEFYFDLEDYDKIKGYCWSAHTGKNGYTTIRARVPGKSGHTIMSWVIVGDKWYDHINHNPLDNRKENLRKVTQTENNRNRSVAKNNTSGITGISLNKRNKNWRSRILVDGKSIELGSFRNKEDAIVARLQAELKYFGEFAPQRHLFEQYKINEKENCA